MDEWARLYDGQVEATPFMHPAWARAWWRYYGDGASPYIVRAGEGLAPLALRRRAGQRVLGPWGSPPGDYWEVLAPGTDAVNDAAAALMSRSREWDAAVLHCVHPDSPFEHAMREAGANVGLSRPIPYPAIELPSDFDEYLGRLPARRRQNIRRHLKRLDEGEITLRELTDPAELPATFEHWQRLRIAQWAQMDQEMNPEHATPRFRDFLCEAAAAMLPTGHALVWEFSAGGEVVGIYVNFADACSFYWYLGGFDLKAASLGLGKIAISHGIRTSIAAGRRRYDFGAGAEPYKYWYGAGDRFARGLILGTSRPRSRLVVMGGVAVAQRRHEAKSEADDA